jgi:hypothetical protein
VTPLRQRRQRRGVRPVGRVTLSEPGTRRPSAFGWVAGLELNHRHLVTWPRGSEWEASFSPGRANILGILSLHVQEFRVWLLLTGRLPKTLTRGKARLRWGSCFRVPLSSCQNSLGVGLGRTTRVRVQTRQYPLDTRCAVNRYFGPGERGRCWHSGTPFEIKKRVMRQRLKLCGFAERRCRRAIIETFHQPFINRRFCSPAIRLKRGHGSHKNQ